MPPPPAASATATTSAVPHPYLAPIPLDATSGAADAPRRASRGLLLLSAGDTNSSGPSSSAGGRESSRVAALQAELRGHPQANPLDHTIEQAGALESCTNGHGVHDMVGNVHEWTDDGSFRGGYYLGTKLDGEGCDYRTTIHPPS